MFRNLTDFKRQRTFKEAIGFYLSYFLLTLLISLLVGGIIGLLTGQGYEAGLKSGQIIAIIACVTLSLLILQKKNLLGHFGYLLLAIFIGIIAFFIGGIIGLIPVAYLTTKRKAA